MEANDQLTQLAVQKKKQKLELKRENMLLN
jgi:hypothetical protein